MPKAVREMKILIKHERSPEVVNQQHPKENVTEDKTADQSLGH